MWSSAVIFIYINIGIHFMDLDKSLKSNREQPSHIYSFQNLEEYDKRLSD